MSSRVITRDQSPVFLDYINRELDTDFTSDSARTITHLRHNDDGTFTILAVAAYNNWRDYHCELSIASSSPMWASWGYIHNVFDYGFNRAGKERVNLVVDVTNTAAINMHKKLGTVLEGTLRDWFGRDRDAYLYALTKRDYEKSKWYKK